MRLLVSCIPYDRGKSGLSVYAREVVRALVHEGHDVSVLADGDVLGRWDEGESLPAPALTLKSFPSPVLSMMWHLFVLPFWMRRRRRDFDGFVICAANRRVCAWYPIPTTATVHDLANFHVAGKYSRLRMFYLAHVLPHFAKKAHRLVAVSESTKSDMVKFWHCRPEDVTVLYNGHRTSEARCGGGAGNPASGARNLLYISRIEHPGKNHVRLIEAYSRLPRELATAHPLVIAGADWKDAETVHEAASRSPHSDLIRFTGFVDDIESVWRESGFYVFPSLFEGFGLSLVEAMARGMPCAASNNGSLGEIAGDAAITFDPGSVDDMAAALRRLLDEPEAERATRVARGREWVRRFSWTDHAKGIVRLVEDAARRPDASMLFNIPVARVTETEAVDRIVAEAKARRGVPFFVATLNVDFVANAVSGWPFGGNDELWGYLRNADLVTADGMPIVLLSRLLGRGLPARVTGADMVPAICRRLAEEGLRAYVLGGDKGAVDEAFSKLGCRDVLVGADSAFVNLDEEQSDIVERINAAEPDVLFVALGNPKQELWIGRSLSKLHVGAVVGVGGTFNFIAGRVRRAPLWMQRCGMEWIYRIVQEPGRLWRRYAYGLVKYSWLSLIHLFGGYRASRAGRGT